MQCVNGQKILLTNFPNLSVKTAPLSYKPYRFPLALNSLKAYVQATVPGVNIEILDRQIEHDNAALVDHFCDHAYDLVGFSVWVGQEPLLRNLLDLILKKIPPHSRPKIVIGNTCATNNVSDILRDYPEVFIIRGEGEYGLRALVEHLQGKKELADVPNLAFVEKSKIQINPIVTIPVSELPGPSSEYLNYTIRSGGVISVEASRGCSWGACSFCNRYSLSKGWRAIPDDIVIKTLRDFKDAGAKQVVFSDEDFIGSDYERTSNLALGIYYEQLGIRFLISIKAHDVFTSKDSAIEKQAKIKTLKALKIAGVDTIFVGVESGSDSQLIRYNKGLTAFENRRVLEILRDLGFRVVAGFIMFDPLVNLEELSENIGFLEECDVLDSANPLSSISVSEHNYLLFSLFKKQDVLGPKNHETSFYKWKFKNKRVSLVFDVMKGWESSRNCYSKFTNFNSIQDQVGAEYDLIQKWTFELMGALKSPTVRFDLALFKALLIQHEVNIDKESFSEDLVELGFGNNTISLLTNPSLISKNSLFQASILHHQTVGIFAEIKLRHLRCCLEDFFKSISLPGDLEPEVMRAYIDSVLVEEFNEINRLFSSVPKMQKKEAFAFT